MEKIYKFQKTEFCKAKREKMKRARGEASCKIKIGYFAIFMILSFAFFIFNLAFVQAAYQQPMYIANPETRECQYYFAGESDCFDACMNDCQGAGLNYTNCIEPCANQYCHYNLRPKGFTVDLGATTNFKDLNESCKIWQDCIAKNGEWNSTALTCKPKPQEQKSSDTLAIAGIAISIMALAAIIIIYFKIRKMLGQMHAEKK